jgi:hypothetical protein
VLCREDAIEESRLLANNIFVAEGFFAGYHWIL